MSSLLRAPLALLAPLLLAAAAHAARPSEAVGLYPVALPEGHEAAQARVLAELHEGAAALPGIRVFDLVGRSACAPDEGACLAEAARGSNLDAVVSAQVEAVATGYRFRVRAFSAPGGALRGEERGEVAGGPLDLEGALEHGVCAALGRGPCEGSLWVGLVPGEDADGQLVIDGVDRGSLPLARPLLVPIGRHRVQAGAAEARVRVAYGRAVRLVATARDGEPALVDAEGRAAPAIAEPAAAPERESASAVARSRPGAPADAVAAPAPGAGLEGAPARVLVARVLLGSGAALIAAGAGMGLYAAANAPRAQATPSGGAPAAGTGGGASTAALLLAASGAGALAVGGIVVMATPGGLAAVGSF